MEQFLCGAGGVAILTGIIELIKWALNRKATLDDRAADDVADDVAELKKMLAHVMVADRMLMYDRIKHLGNAHLAKGWVSVEELEDLDKMHSVYHSDLDGNGFLDNLMEAVHALPLRAR